MSRVIKFRAWHHEGCLDDQPMTMTYWKFGSGLDNSQFFKHAKAVMQYTGLKDKNGVEIYEGDILRREHTTNHHVITGEVVYSNSKASFILRNGDTVGALGSQTVEADAYTSYYGNEVIGNIYENPDLLEQTK